MWETLISCLPCMPWTCNFGRYPDRESNQQPFSVQDDSPTNWATPARATYINIRQTLNQYLNWMTELSQRNLKINTLGSFIEFWNTMKKITLLLQMKFPKLQWTHITSRCIFFWGIRKNNIQPHHFIVMLSYRYTTLLSRAPSWNEI